MDESRKVAVPDKNNPYLQSDRNRQEIIQALDESQGKEESLSFSAKEVRGLLSQIIHLEERAERLRRAR